MEHNYRNADLCDSCTHKTRCSCKKQKQRINPWYICDEYINSATGKKSEIAQLQAELKCKHKNTVHGELKGLTAFELCIDCGKCATVCPARLPVNRLSTVRSPECLGCYQCVSDCPVDGALEMAFGSKTRVEPAWIAAGIMVIFLGLILGARLTGHWHTDIPDEVYFELIPAADQFPHP